MHAFRNKYLLLQAGIGKCLPLPAGIYKHLTVSLVAVKRMKVVTLPTGGIPSPYNT